MLRILAKRGGVVRLLVGMPFPPWWSSRLFDDAIRDSSGLGHVAHVLSLRSAEVFAACPAALTLPKEESAGFMVRYVDGIERAVVESICSEPRASTRSRRLCSRRPGSRSPFSQRDGTSFAAFRRDVVGGLPRILARPRRSICPISGTDRDSRRRPPSHGALNLGGTISALARLLATTYQGSRRIERRERRSLTWTLLRERGAAEDRSPPMTAKIQ